MKKIRHSSVLKAITLLGLMLAFPTTILYLLTFLIKSACPPVRALELALLTIGTCSIGYGINLGLTLLEEKQKIRPVLHKLLWIASAVLVGVLYDLFASDGFVYSLLVSVMLTAMYLIFSHLVMDRYEQMFNETVLVFGAIQSLVILLLLYLVKINVHPIDLYDSIFVYNFLPVVLCYFISRNQGNIDFLMERRRHDLSHLPKKIRRYNIILLVVLFVVLLLLFIFRAPLTAFLWRVVRFIKSILQAVFYFLVWVITHLTGGSGEQETPEEEELGTMDGSLQAGISVDYTVMAALGLTLVLVVYHKEIFAWLREKIRRLIQWLGKLIFSASKRQRPIDGNAYYTDEVASLEETDRNLKEKNRLHSPRMWKRSYRRYQKLTGEQRIRVGFRLWMDWLILHGEELKVSATVSDIVDCTGKYLTSPERAEASLSYEKFRYAEQLPDETALRSMDELLEQLQQKWTK